MASSSSSAPAALANTVTDAPGVQTPGGQDTIPKAIEVSLRLNISVNEAVSLFGYPADQASNEVIIDNKLSASALNGLFTFREDPSGPNLIVGGRGAGVLAAATQIHNAVATGTNDNNVDVGSVSPFSNESPKYRDGKYRTVGDMVLSWVARNMFGGSGATAAIDNDTTIVSHVNNTTLSSASLKTALDAISQSDLDAIAASVIGQDNSRAGSAENRATPRALNFYAGDKLFVRITLSGFTASNANSNQEIDAASYGIEGAVNQYDLSLTVQ